MTSDWTYKYYFNQKNQSGTNDNFYSTNGAQTIETILLTFCVGWGANLTEVKYLTNERHRFGGTSLARFVFVIFEDGK